MYSFSEFLIFSRESACLPNKLFQTDECKNFRISNYEISFLYFFSLMLINSNNRMPTLNNDLWFFQATLDLNLQIGWILTVSKSGS